MISIRFLSPLAKCFSLLAAATVCGAGISAFAQTPPVFSQIVVFGDSLSDTGNFRDRTDEESEGAVDYPSHTFNYSNGRFTNDDQTDPASALYAGVWHEQLAQSFLSISPASYSLGGGTNYAFGGATTVNGAHEEFAVETPFGDVTITVDDMGKQMDDYLAAHTVDPTALYIVWGGGNDLRNDDSAANVTATAARATALVGRLVNAGAQHIMVPNVPPLGDVPRYFDDPAKIRSSNTAAANYRLELKADLAALVGTFASQGITATIYSPDIWASTLRLFSDPARYGFINTLGSAQDDNAVNPDKFAFWDDVHPTTAAHHLIAQAAYDSLTIAPAPLSKALNIATRAFVGTGEQVPIAGFVVTGDVSKRVLIRGIGPSLAASGVPGPLADPTLTLFDSSGKPFRTNDNWRDSQASEIIATGIPPQNDLESAIVVTLSPGNYTAILAGRNETTGNGLVEVYDLEADTGSTLANLSTRGFAGTANDALIGSLIIGSGDSAFIVLRAIGPSLAAAGIGGPLLDPTIELHDSSGALIGFNDDWSGSQTQAVNATLLAPTAARESTIVAPFLAPGNYTAIVRGQNETTGVALVEVYRVP
jgi:phospholipase/lecithinase/hemolysin